MDMVFLFDALLLALLIGLAVLLLSSSDLFKAVVLFISFGLLLSLAWIRLGAPDVALAEAAIGAGITGALLLVGLGRLSMAERCLPLPPPVTALQRLSSPLLVGILTPLVMAIILMSLSGLDELFTGQQQLVTHHLPQSGVEHPVTAVLLNFRGYDTLLEMGVLLLALLCVWSLDSARPLFRQQQISPVLTALCRLLLPILIIVAGVLLWQGGYRAGGAFQAGALLTAGILLAVLAGHPIDHYRATLPVRLLLASGFFLFLLVAATTLMISGTPLTYPIHLAGGLIVLIELVATLSIAVLLAAIIAGGYPPEESP